MQLLLDDSLLKELSSLGGGGTRVRPEVVSAYSVEGTVGIAIAPSPIDIGEDLHRFATFCWDMPDNDLCSRGNAHVFCDRFPDNKPLRGDGWDSTPKVNISNRLLTLVRRIRPDTSPRDLVFYSYAVLCSGTLLEAFADAYFTVSAKENIPRIPIVNDPNLMDFLIQKGREIARLERLDTDIQLPTWIANLECQYPGEFNLEKWCVDFDLLEIRLYANGANLKIRLEGFSRELLQLKISGYEVISCWLKFHSFAYTRTTFSLSNFKELLHLFARLQEQAALIVQVDDVLEGVISGEVALL